MSGVGRAMALATLLLALAGLTAPSARADAAATAAPLSVTIAPTAMATSLGRHFTFDTAVRNDSARRATGLVAHLDVVSLDPSVYVDPEDWSSQRTKYLGPVPAHSVVTLHWSMQAVNSGRLIVYVVVYDANQVSVASTPQPLRVAIASRRTLDAGGVLPLALAIPGALLLLIGATARRRRRLR
jgi:hypothetical protein